MQAKCEYTIVYGNSSQELEQKVAILLSHGWRPTGGVAVRPSSGELLQAMTKEYEWV